MAAGLPPPVVALLVSAGHGTLLVSMLLPTVAVATTCVATGFVSTSALLRTLLVIASTCMMCIHNTGQQTGRNNNRCAANGIRGVGVVNVAAALAEVVDAGAVFKRLRSHKNCRRNLQLVFESFRFGQCFVLRGKVFRS